jgi:hypothetical protein
LSAEVGNEQVVRVYQLALGHVDHGSIEDVPPHENLARLPSKVRAP